MKVIVRIIRLLLLALPNVLWERKCLKFCCRIKNVKIHFEPTLLKILDSLMDPICALLTVTTFKVNGFQLQYINVLGISNSTW